MATDPTILAVREMIGLVKQNIEFTLKKDRFLHCLKTKQPLNDRAANGCLEPKVTNAAVYINASFPKNRLLVIYLGPITTSMMDANALASETQPSLPKAQP